MDSAKDVAVDPEVAHLVCDEPSGSLCCITSYPTKVEVATVEWLAEDVATVRAGLTRGRRAVTAKHLRIKATRTLEVR